MVMEWPGMLIDAQIHFSHNLYKKPIYCGLGPNGLSFSKTRSPEKMFGEIVSNRITPNSIQTLQDRMLGLELLT